MAENPDAVRRPYMVDDNGNGYWHGGLGTFQAHTNGVKSLWPAVNQFPLPPWPSLTGAGRTISLWDVNVPSAGHEQFNGRVTNIDPVLQPPPNAPPETIARFETAISHATSAACVICGQGDPTVVFPGDLDVSDDLPETARGMSYESGVRARSSENDTLELMVDAANPALTPAYQLHPYATDCGWKKRSINPPAGQPEWRWFGNPVIDDEEDWQFGAYPAAHRQHRHDLPQRARRNRCCRCGRRATTG